MVLNDLLNKGNFNKDELIYLLHLNGEDKDTLLKKGKEIKAKYVGNTVYYRGLIEFSNICAKNCYYCGIRASNPNTDRYELDNEDILKAAKFAYENRYASVVLQSGERFDKKFVDKVDFLLNEIKKLSHGELGITLSTGEQTEDVYKRWFDSGAHRYLLRIETSNKELYKKLHPDNKLHSFETRLEALKTLKRLGYQAGSGVMVGVPFQTYEDLANDILFLQEYDIDMVGMGPYIEHEDTPMWEYRDLLLPKKERFELTLKMIAILRILLKDINIAAATAMQAIDPVGREKALNVGANIIMPNITPTVHRKNYNLYQGKPCIDEGAEDCNECLEARISMIGDTVGYGEWGDSLHFKLRNVKE
jgi:biotin synthase